MFRHLSSQTGKSGIATSILEILMRYLCILEGHPAWWRHQMETFSALLAICAGNSPVTGEFLTQRPATRSFDVFFDLDLNERLSEQPWGLWFETPSRPLWRHGNGLVAVQTQSPNPLQINTLQQQNENNSFVLFIILLLLLLLLLSLLLLSLLLSWSSSILLSLLLS